MTDEKIKEVTLRISQANASGLVAIIYELTIETLQEAVDAFAQDDKEEYKALVRKGEKYVQELMHGLEFESEIARSISHDYARINSLLIQGRITLDENLILQARDILLYLQPTFVRIAKEDSDAPMMENTQKVYAGLTYGKTSLNELAVDPMKNRGYTV